MKLLKFRPHLVDLILDGQKTTTWRLFDDKDIKSGDRLLFVDWETGKEFATAEAVKVVEKKLGAIDENDYAGNQHEKFENEEEMIETYRRYYGDKVDRETMVKIIHFKLN